MFRVIRSASRAFAQTALRTQRPAATGVTARLSNAVIAPKVAHMSSGCPFLRGDASAFAKAASTQTGAAQVIPTATAATHRYSSSEAPKAGLTPEQTAIVKATVPILEEGGVALTTHFYSILMKRDNIRPLFNQTHQASGAQPRALAFSVLSYAKNIDALENLGPLATQIVNKHVSFQVMPEHYPIVGECLLQAIAEVLGPKVATPEVIAAWAAAYQQLADILIAAEAKVYDEIAAAPGGWRGVREFIVKAKTAASPDSSIASFDLVPKDGGPVLAYSPGQYLGLITRPGTPLEARRNYSLSKAADSKSLRITVKRMEGGAVSTYLHDSVQVGDSLSVLIPAGEFVLTPDNSPIMLISAGVGITPVMSMLEAATAPETPDRKIAFLHYTHNSRTQAFTKDIEAIAEKAKDRVKLYTAYTDGTEVPTAPAAPFTGQVTKEHLAEVLTPLGSPESVTAFVLGPQGFMKTVKDQLLELGVPLEKIKYEFFGPAAQI